MPLRLPQCVLKMIGLSSCWTRLFVGWLFSANRLNLAGTEWAAPGLFGNFIEAEGAVPSCRVGSRFSFFCQITKMIEWPDYQEKDNRRR